MKILYIHQYFKTPEDGGSIRSYHLAKGLVDKGHQVTMITSWNKEKYAFVNIDGINVHFLPIFYDNQLGFFSRLRSFLGFFFSGIRFVIKERNFDKAYVMTTPLTTGLFALFIRYFLNKPYIFEVGDLWPEVPVQMGIVRNPILRKLSYAFEKKCYQKSADIVALSPGIRDYIKKVVPHKAVHVVTNISDRNRFDSAVDMTEKGLESFVIAYVGTAGMANHLEFLIHAAALVEKSHLPVKIKIQAEGAELKKIKDLSLSLGLSCVKFLPWTSTQGVVELLAKSDAVYLSFDDFPALATGSPNKFFDGLAAGKLIISNFGGWIKDLIEEENCGFSYDPHNPEELIVKLKSLLSDSSRLADMKHNARRLSDQFSVEKSVEKIENLIKS